MSVSRAAEDVQDALQAQSVCRRRCTPLCAPVRLLGQGDDQLLVGLEFAGDVVEVLSQPLCIRFLRTRNRVMAGWPGRA
ncbi:hypothetical protein CP970_23485 [Streptomyces kanamyceticus]|uniref:Uncharacterized protein n=1 Tax=Streptomyces kanamyceticus TaxID=1967 RepID=A0A5J6GK23_STRKN|nr:hypothetical protein CP970_23485 [Streptomyces kanamyceticus]